MLIDFSINLANIFLFYFPDYLSELENLTDEILADDDICNEIYKFRYENPSYSREWMRKFLDICLDNVYRDS